MRGAALLVALMLMALVATLAAGAWSLQWRAWHVERTERDRAQAAWLLTGALDWARLILREDGRASRTDHLAEPWAVPLQPTRLSTFLRATANDGTDVLD
ncbi:MAG: type II secretion system protein GspK, partial [Tepidimonas sp.]